MRAYDQDLRRKVVDAYERGEGSLEEIGDLFAVALHTVWNWVRQWRATGDLAPRYHGPGVPPRIHGVVLEALRARVAADPTTTLADLAAWLEVEHGVVVSLTAVSRALARAAITRKKVIPRAAERDRPGVEAERAVFRHRMAQWDGRKIVVLDEFGVNLGLAPHFGWAPVGERATPTVPKNGGPNVTLIFGLRADGVVAPSLFVGPMTAHVMESYARDILGPTLQPGDIVVMDNLSAHHDEDVVAAIEATGARVEFLPPYSPDLTPIEECGSKVKTLVRKALARAYAALADAVGAALGAVTATDALHYFEDVGLHVKA